MVTPPAPQSRAGLICCTAAQVTVDSVAVPPPTSPVAPATRPRIWTPPCSPATCPRHINWWARWRPGWPREGVRPRVASMAGPVGLAGGAAYGASKAALTAMTHGWAAEFSPSSVRINSVAPSPGSHRRRQRRFDRAARRNDAPAPRCPAGGDPPRSSRCSPLPAPVMSPRRWSMAAALRSDPDSPTVLERNYDPERGPGRFRRPTTT